MFMPDVSVKEVIISCHIYKPMRHSISPLLIRIRIIKERKFENKMILTLTLLFNIFKLAQSIAGFECYCNLNHPEALVFNCPGGAGFPIAALRIPHQVFKYQTVNLQTPYCVPKLINVQASGHWVPVYYSGNLGYLNLDADFTLKTCTGMLAFNPNKLITSPLCKHRITNVPGLSVTGVKPSVNKPWKVITNAPSTKPAHWIPMHNVQTTVGTWHKIPQIIQTPSWQHTGGNRGKCHGPDIENDVKNANSIFYYLSRVCPLNGAATDEVTAAKYCSAPEPKVWIQGKKVVGNCPFLPKYTPVSIFNGGKATGDGTAIFVECTKAGNIKVVRQTCKSKTIELVEIIPTVDLFVVEW